MRSFGQTHYVNHGCLCPSELHARLGCLQEFLQGVSRRCTLTSLDDSRERRIRMGVPLSRKVNFKTSASDGILRELYTSSLTYPRDWELTSNLTIIFAIWFIGSFIFFWICTMKFVRFIMKNAALANVPKHIDHFSKFSPSPLSMKQFLDFGELLL